MGTRHTVTRRIRTGHRGGRFAGDARRGSSASNAAHAATVSVRARGGGDGTGVLFGTYHGRGEAAGVRIETTGHDVEGRTLTLAGHPGWGAWYVHVGGGTGRVTVYDATGKVIAATGRAR